MSEFVCQVCGVSLDLQDRFCSSCGARVAAAGDTSTIPVATGLAEPVVSAASQPQSDLPSGVAALVVQRGPEAGTRFLLAGKASFGVGRESGSDIFLDDVTVSRQHALVSVAGQHWSIEDSRSLNGTEVNGNRAAHADLHEGDTVTNGKFHFTFHIGGQR